MKKILVLSAFLIIITVNLAATSGEILAIKGKVEVQKAGQWKLAQQGETLDSGTLISTGFKSELTLKVDGSTIIVQALTRLRLDEIVKKGDVLSSKVYLDMGSIKANVKPAETKKVAFTVRTPVATASVRGTSGEISYDGVLNGWTGVWEYVNQNQDAVKVYAGDTVKIDNFGNITPTQIAFQNDVKPQTPTTIAEKDTDYNGVDESKHNQDFDEGEIDASDSSNIGTIVVDLDWEE